MNILLVEDSATLRFAMESYIQDAGHESIAAENGEKAVQLVEQGNIDMILMDVEMPGLNGFETTHLIRESLGQDWIPIIFVTGKSSDESFEEGIAVGGDDYLIKPVGKVILQAKIRAMERIANMRSQLHILNKELTQLSQHDGLTQLLNRRTFDERAHEAWRLAARSKQPLGILLVDIDFFKRFNDSYGHQAGDDCIKQVASAVKECCNRPGDIVARYGGEEFIVLLPNTDIQGAQHVAETLRGVVEKLQITHIGSPDHNVVTVSIGGSVIKYTTGSDVDDLIANADEALYESKNHGRNHCTVREFKDLHKVLLIDNDDGRIQRIESVLNDHCQLHLVRSEQEAKSAHASSMPELVLLTVNAIDDPSIAAYRRARDKSHLSVVPLLLISSLDKASLKPIGKSLGANGSINQNFDDHRLIAEVHEYLRH